MHVADGRRDDGRARRQRDRRRGLGEVVAVVARAVAARGEGSSVRTAFEEALLRVLPVRSIALREQASRWSTERQDEEVESLAFEVAAPTPAQRGLLQAVFDRGSRLGDWDFQLLGQAAQLAALVLDVERARGPAARGTHGSTARSRRDGAAPLIGSTPAMAALRDRIERVANTDFTVLLEGGTRAELANSLWPGFARECTNGQVAGAG